VRLQLQMQAEKLILHTLDPTGQSRSSREICPTSPGRFEVTLANPTLWYGLVASQTKCLTTSTGPNPAAGGLRVYPNPAQGRLRVDWGGQPATELRLYTVLGTAVRQLAPPPGQAATELDLSGLPAGLYLLQAGAEVRRVVVRE
jgi:Secretion system C-terminal sorting domain